MSSLFSTIVAAFRCPPHASLCSLVHSSRLGLILFRAQDSNIKEPTSTPFSGPGPGPGVYLLVCGVTQRVEEVASGTQCRCSVDIGHAVPACLKVGLVVISTYINSTSRRSSKRRLYEYQCNVPPHFAAADVELERHLWIRSHR
ncbi:hypothetical protein B0H11DRAFT_2204589 [Mycena galericulata]|nr:hypothetical protein B0H11DRAFT_2204589 [Mycena galericulata]